MQEFTIFVHPLLYYLDKSESFSQTEILPRNIRHSFLSSIELGKRNGMGTYSLSIVPHVFFGIQTLKVNIQRKQSSLKFLNKSQTKSNQVSDEF